MSMLLALIVISLFYLLAYQAALRSSPDLVKNGIGFKLGRIIFLLFLILNILITVHFFVSVVHSNNLPRTPELALSSTLLITAGYGAWKGIENIARLSILSFLFTMTTITIIPLTIIDELLLTFVYPIFDQPINQIAYGAWQTIGAFLDNFFVFALLPYVHFKSPRRLPLLWACFSISALLILVIFLSNFFTFGPELGGNLVFPSLELVKYITFGEFLERIEVVMISVWVISLTFKTSLLLWICQHECERIFHVPDGRSILIPIVLACSFLTLQVFPNVSALYFFYAHIWVYCVCIGYAAFLLVRFLDKRTK